MDAEDAPKCEEKRKRRKRMKGVFGRIREQMEFYFSDSNLHRDRFMKKQITESEDGYMDLSVFLNFNKIKAITTDISVVGKALSHSKLLEVSEDGQKVKRTKAVSKPQQLDDRTVYVECLPHQADHDWIKRIFSSCGKVVYVSLPRYKSTGDMKGFAFVEFESVEEAKKACEDLNNPPADVDERPGKFPKTRKQLTQLQRKLGDAKPEDVEGIEDQTSQAENNKEPLESPTKLSRKQKKRRRQTSESSIDGTTSETSPVKRRKTLSSTESDREQKTKSDVEKSVGPEEEKDEEESKKQKKGKKRKQKNQVELTTDSEADVSKDGEAVDKGREGDKVKKRKVSGVDTEESHKEECEGGGSVVEGGKKRRKDSGIEIDSCKDNTEPPVKRSKGEITPAKSISKEKKVELSSKKRRRKKKKKQKEKDVPELRVISKKDWLELRAEYLSLQKKSMTNLKKTINKLQQDEDLPAMEAKNTDKRDNSNEMMKEEKKSEPKSKIEFVPNVIVKVNSGQSFTRKQLKDDLGPDFDIAYIDVQDGDKDGYIRFKSSDEARKLSESASGSYFFSLIQGEEEQKYWTKLEADRDTKLNRKTKSKKRGSQKVTLPEAFSICRHCYPNHQDIQFRHHIKVPAKLIDKAQKINKENVERKHIVFTD